MGRGPQLFWMTETLVSRKISCWTCMTFEPSGDIQWKFLDLHKIIFFLFTTASSMTIFWKIRFFKNFLHKKHVNFSALFQGNFYPIPNDKRTFSRRILTFLCYGGRRERAACSVFPNGNNSTHIWNDCTLSPVSHPLHGCVPPSAPPPPRPVPPSPIIRLIQRHHPGLKGAFSRLLEAGSGGPTVGQWW